MVRVGRAVEGGKMANAMTILMIIRKKSECSHCNIGGLGTNPTIGK